MVYQAKKNGPMGRPYFTVFSKLVLNFFKMVQSFAKEGPVFPKYSPSSKVQLIPIPQNDCHRSKLMKENRDIQHKLRQSLPKKDTTEHIAKCFAHLMLQGKVHAALRLLDKNEELGLAELNAENITKLTALHPEAADADESILMSGELPYFDPIVFQNIDEAAIAKAAHRTRGAAGPSGLDADGWRRMLVSKNYGESGVRKLVKRFGQQFPR